jgi:hypothetical protein
MPGQQEVHCGDKKQISSQHMQQAEIPPLKEVSLMCCETTQWYQTERKEARLERN